MNRAKRVGMWMVLVAIALSMVSSIALAQPVIDLAGTGMTIPIGTAVIEQMLAADVNNDGYDDLIIASRSPNTVRVMSGQDFSILYSFSYVTNLVASGSVGTIIQLDLTAYGKPIAVGDTNGDGYQDVILRSGSSLGEVVKVYSGQDGSLLQQFDVSTVITDSIVAKTAAALDAADIDGDGKAEIFIEIPTGKVLRIAGIPVSWLAGDAVIILEDDGSTTNYIAPEPTYTAEYTFNGRFASPSQQSFISGGKGIDCIMPCNADEPNLYRYTTAGPQQTSLAGAPRWAGAASYPLRDVEVWHGSSTQTDSIIYSTDQPVSPYNIQLYEVSFATGSPVETLLKSYSSGQSVYNLLVINIFGLGADQLLVWEFDAGYTNPRLQLYSKDFQTLYATFLNAPIMEISGDFDGDGVAELIGSESGEWKVYMYGTVCGDNICQAGEICAADSCPPPTCSDSIQNQDETGVDCGGAVCPACLAPCTDSDSDTYFTTPECSNPGSASLNDIYDSEVMPDGTINDGNTRVEVHPDHRGFFMFSLSSLPANAIPYSALLRLDFEDIKNDDLYDVSSVEALDPLADGLALYNDLDDGAKYVDNGETNVLKVSKTIDLVNALSDIQSSISKGWFGLGFSISADFMKIRSMESAQPPYIEINYYTRQLDCNDVPPAGSAIYPGAAEICGDGIDQDCNGADLACAAPPTCTFTNSYWSAESTTAGSKVTMTVEGTNCADGEQVNFNIWEDDLIFSEDISDQFFVNPTAVFNGGTAAASWYAIFVPDGPGGLFDPPEFYFNAELASDPSVSLRSQGPAADGLIDVWPNSIVSKPVPFLIKPNGGEVYDQSASILWNAAVDPEDDAVVYSLYYSEDSGQTWNLITGNYGYINSAGGQSSFTFSFG